MGLNGGFKLASGNSPLNTTGYPTPYHFVGGREVSMRSCCAASVIDVANTIIENASVAVSTVLPIPPLHTRCDSFRCTGVACMSSGAGCLRKGTG